LNPSRAYKSATSPLAVLPPKDAEPATITLMIAIRKISAPTSSSLNFSKAQPKEISIIPPPPNSKKIH
jgi:hypothetical protein